MDIAHQLIFDAVPAMIWFKDDANRILRCNRAAAESRGVSVADMEGRLTEELFPDEAAAYLADDLEVIRSGRSKLGIVEPYHLGAGRKGWVRTDKIPYRDPSGKVGVVVFAQDITLQVEAERALRASQEQLRQSQKMEAIGRLAGGVAHDFNNLLAIIRGRAHLIMSRLPPGDPRAADAADIADASERASALTQQLLLFSRRQVATPEEVDVNEVVDRLAGMLARTSFGDVAVRTVLSPRAPKARINRSQLEQIVMNLALNARDAVGARGTVLLETDVTDASAVLRVSDNGTGMDEDTLRRACEPYFTTKERGTGLGLATVYGIAFGAGGALALRSQVGEGTTCEVTLPRTDVPARESTRALDETVTRS